MLEEWVYLKGFQKVSQKSREKHVVYGPVVDVQVEVTQSLGQFLLDTLKRHPQEKVILSDGETGEKVTVGELLETSIKLSVGLKKEGVKAGDVVAIVAENSISANYIALATWFTGAVMSPIDPALRSYEFQHIFRITNPSIVFCENQVLDQVKEALTNLQKLNIPVYVFQNNVEKSCSQMANLIGEESVEDFTVEPVENNRKSLASIICSSGTTGLSKGVGLSDYSHIIQAKVDTAILSGAIIIQTSYFYWISGVLMLLMSWAAGSQRLLLRTADPVKVLRAIDTYKPQTGLLAPSLFMSILSHPHIDAFDLTSLSKVIVGGSPLLLATLKKAKEILPNVEITQGYGCTEIGGLISSTSKDTDVLSVGRVVKNVLVKISDQTTGEALPPGEEGEIMCKGPGLMLCYIANEEATKNAFDDEGWYKTGDLGKVTNDNVLYITGRIKELLKVDNHQVAPAEIEEIICKLPGVKEVAVAGIPVGENSLPIALVVPAASTTLSAEDIILAVKENLSEFKQLRAGVHFVLSLPRTSTGKLKRNQLQLIAEELYNANQEANL